MANLSSETINKQSSKTVELLAFLPVQCTLLLANNLAFCLKKETGSHDKCQSKNGKQSLLPKNMTQK